VVSIGAKAWQPFPQKSSVSEVEQGKDKEQVVGNEDGHNEAKLGEGHSAPQDHTPGNILKIHPSSSLN